MPKYYLVDIFNVDFIIKANTDEEINSVDCLMDIIESRGISVEGICKWCVSHKIIYGMRFKLCKYKKDTIRKNIRYLKEYIKLKKDLEKYS